MLGTDDSQVRTVLVRMLEEDRAAPARDWAGQEPRDGDRNEAAELLEALRGALNGTLPVSRIVEQEPAVRDALTSLSERRARAGARPSATAMAILALKRTMLSAVEQHTDDSAPRVRLWRHVLAVPLIGTLDSARTQVVMNSLLESIQANEARVAIIDITGVRDLIAHTSHTLAAIEPGLMATVVLARVDPATGRTRFANGGHPEPVLVTAAEPARLLPAPVPGRGVGFPDPGSRELVEVVLAEGDTVLLYTDGLVESRKDVDEGQARLLTLAERLGARPAAGLPRELVTRMHDVVLHADDTVVLALRRTPVE